MSWKPEVFVEQKWSRNGLVFATKQEAETSARDLMFRWTMVLDSRAVEVDEPVNYRLVDGRLEEVKPEHNAVDGIIEAMARGAGVDLSDQPNRECSGPQDLEYDPDATTPLDEKAGDEYARDFEREAKPILFSLTKVRINKGGYDRQGSYWGTGDPLYWAVSDEGAMHMRAKTRSEAMEQVRRRVPTAKFRRQS